MLVENSDLELRENRLLVPGDYFQNIVEMVREQKRIESELDGTHDLALESARPEAAQTLSCTR